MRTKGCIRRLGTAQFLELLLSLAESGVPVPVAVRLLEKRPETERLAEKIRKEMEDGGTLCEALCGLSGKLSEFETMLSAAEETGDIVPALSGIAEELREMDDDRKNLAAIIIYPLAVCVLSLTGGIFLAVRGIQYIKVIADLDGQEIIKNLSAATVWPVAVYPLLLVAALHEYKKYDFQYVFFRNLYYMSVSHVGMEDAFRVLLGEKPFTKKDTACVAGMLRGIRDGRKLSDVFVQSGRFDMFTTAWLSVTDGNGELVRGFEKIYENYRKKRRETRELLRRFLEPALTAVCGIYVLLLAAGCIIPVFGSLGKLVM